jgi:serine/threonine protein kinase
MRGSDCISDDDLRAFLLGELPERVARVVSDHLEHCPACEATASALDADTDPTVRSLRRAVGRDSGSLKDPGGTASVQEEHREAATNLAPVRVADYEVLRELGRGGMGVVYKARQRRPERVVALKLLLAGTHSGAERRVRLLGEADVLARLRHPNIVQVFEVGQHEGLPFLALEYVEGGSLTDRLDGTPQPPRQGAALVETLARAVHYAHEQGIVHRDLKPANVLLAFRDASQKRSGEQRFCEASLNACVPKITDFGLAKQEGPGLTATGAVLGTPSYMAPEQAEGNKEVGPAADVWALGAILYECLTGRPPFKSATPLETLQQLRTQEPVAPRQLQPGVPRDLETVCLKCLEKDPRRRYPTAQALAEDLGRYLRHEPIAARPVGSLERLAKWARRRPAVAALSGSLLVLAAVGFGLVTWQ